MWRLAAEGTTLGHSGCDQCVPRLVRKGRQPSGENGKEQVSAVDKKCSNKLASRGLQPVFKEMGRTGSIPTASTISRCTLIVPAVGIERGSLAPQGPWQGAKSGPHGFGLVLSPPVAPVKMFCSDRLNM